MLGGQRDPKICQFIHIAIVGGETEKRLLLAPRNWKAFEK